MTDDKFIPPLSQLHEHILLQEHRFRSRGYEIDVKPDGVRTLGGWRGLSVTARTANGTEHTMSVTSEVSAINLVRIAVDGNLRDELTGGTLINPADDRLFETVKPFLDWFIDKFLAT